MLARRFLESLLREPRLFRTPLVGSGILATWRTTNCLKPIYSGHLVRSSSQRRSIARRRKKVNATIEFTSSLVKLVKARQGIIGASSRPSGRFPAVTAVTICASVQPSRAFVGYDQRNPARRRSSEGYPQGALKVRPARSSRRLRKAGPISAPGVQMPPSPCTSRRRPRALSVIILLVEP